MKMPSSLGLPLLLVLSLLILSLIAAAAAITSRASTPAASASAAKRYICPPCGSPCDTASYASPGICKLCGMALVEASAAAAQAANEPPPKKVAFLIFDGAEVIDFTGPYEMFGAAGCEVYTVGATRAPITTAMGLNVVPKYSFADAPQPDVLVIPGGGVKAASTDEATLRYIKDVTARDTHTMSVCNGAFILANTGLLDGLSATTTYHNIPRLTSQYPKIKVVNQRYVDNGKLITTAGLTAGMDGALHVIERLYGTGYAQDVALGEEYDWKPSQGFARAELADHELPEVDVEGIGEWRKVRTEGDTSHWDVIWKGQSQLSTSDLMTRIERALVDGKWTKVGTASEGPASSTSTWRFTGSDGKPWKGTVKLESVGSTGHEYTAALAVVRAG